MDTTLINSKLIEFFKKIDYQMEQLLNHPIPELILKENAKLILEIKNRTGQYDFEKSDFKTGQIGGAILLNYLLLNNNIPINVFNKTKYFDHEMEKNGILTQYEAKTDCWCKKSGNIAVEFESFGIPSGALASTAKYFVHVVPFQTKIILYFVERTKLVDLIEENFINKTYKTHQIMNEENGNIKNVLVPLEEFKKLCVKIVEFDY